MNNVVDLRPFEVVGIVINHMLYNFISHSFANTYIQNLSPKCPFVPLYEYII